MPATVAKYLNVSQVTLSISNGQTEDDASIGPNLSKQKDDGTGYEYVVPDSVFVEIVGGHNIANAPLMQITREGYNVRLTARYANAVGADVTILARVTCVYWHSMYGTDHTI